MNTLTLHRPGHFEFTVDFPATWNECTPIELVNICRRLINPNQTAAMQRAGLLLDLLRLRTASLRLPNRWIEMIDIDDFGIASADLLSFIFSDSTLTRQPFPMLSLPWYTRRRPGPADGFKDLKAGEYEDADIQANLFALTKEAKHLQLLAATLYRPSRRWDPDYKAEAHLRYFQRMDPAVLMTIYTWFKGCQALLPRYFPEVMKKPAGEASPKKPDLTIFTQCIHAAAGPKNGTRAQVRALPILELLFDMNLEAKEHRKQLEEMKKKTK